MNENDNDNDKNVSNSIAKAMGGDKFAKKEEPKTVNARASLRPASLAPPMRDGRDWRPERRTSKPPALGRRPQELAAVRHELLDMLEEAGWLVRSGAAATMFATSFDMLVRTHFHDTTKGDR